MKHFVMRKFQPGFSGNESHSPHERAYIELDQREMSRKRRKNGNRRKDGKRRR